MLSGVFESIQLYQTSRVTLRSNSFMSYSTVTVHCPYHNPLLLPPSSLLTRSTVAPYLAMVSVTTVDLTMRQKALWGSSMMVMCVLEKLRTQQLLGP